MECRIDPLRDVNWQIDVRAHKEKKLVIKINK
jgi:hypothetical protein